MGAPAVHDPLGPFVADPQGSALLFDVDGVLAPIVARPSLSEVPAESLAALADLVAAYRLVACVSGRALEDLRRLVPVPGVLLSGNHGLELDDGSGPRLAPGLEALTAELAALRDELRPAVEEAGAWIEDKGGLTVTLHYREAPDPAAAHELLWARARALAGDRPLELRPARMALELRPRVPLDKGTAVRALLELRPCRRSLFAGDDVTDLDAFAEVDLAIAVRSAESPPGLLEAAGLVVDDVPALLARLSAARGAA
jgi:trehalose 6-phosphate phosphatase